METQSEHVTLRDRKTLARVRGRVLGKVVLVIWVTPAINSTAANGHPGSQTPQTLSSRLRPGRRLSRLFLDVIYAAPRATRTPNTTVITLVYSLMLLPVLRTERTQADVIIVIIFSRFPRRRRLLLAALSEISSAASVSESVPCGWEDRILQHRSITQQTLLKRLLPSG